MESIGTTFRLAFLGPRFGVSFQDIISPLSNLHDSNIVDLVLQNWYDSASAGYIIGFDKSMRLCVCYYQQATESTTRAAAFHAFSLFFQWESLKPSTKPNKLSDCYSWLLEMFHSNQVIPSVELDSSLQRAGWDITEAPAGLDGSGWRLSSSMGKITHSNLSVNMSSEAAEGESSVGRGRGRGSGSGRGGRSPSRSRKSKEN